MVVAALLAVVVGQALLANGQVKLAALQQQLITEQSAHRQAELSDAKLETPARIVADATSQLHMVAAGASVIELPYVSLSVPLPTPKVTPAPAPPPPTTSAAGAGAPAGDGTTGNTGTGSTSATSATSATTPTSTP